MAKTKTLNDYLKTFEKDYFNNAVDSVLFDNSQYVKVSRYKSWDHCYVFFCDLRKKYSKPEDITEEDMNLACLNLAFYLASWGMYRGSGAIYNFDYTIYEKVIRTLFDPYYEELWYLDDTLRSIYFNNKNDIEKLFCCKKDTGENVTGEDREELIKKLSAEINNIVDKIYKLGKKIEQDLLVYYIYDNDIYFLNEKTENIDEKTGVEKEVLPSDTLITKIMLGTIGCMPGLDSNFKKAIGYYDYSFIQVKISYILLIAVINLDVLTFKQNYIKNSKYQYPFMKLLDIYYFTRGAEKDLIDYMNICKESGNAADWFKSLKLSEDSNNKPDKKKVTKAISQVCYRKDIKDRDSGYDIKMAYPKANEFEENIKSIIHAGKNKDFMRDYCGGKKIGEEKYKELYEEIND